MELEEVAKEVLEYTEEKPRIFYNYTAFELQENTDLEIDGKKVTTVKFFRGDKEELDPHPGDKVVFYGETTTGVLEEITREDLER